MKKVRSGGAKRGGRRAAGSPGPALPGKPARPAAGALATQSRRLLGKHYANRYGKRRG